MTTDYAKLTEENLLEYGHAVRHLEIITELYSARGHFIWELLQNAEDAGASALRFSLALDRLELRHDGRPFTERDVRSICKVAESAKLDDPPSIGRFGIGFKSVYSYTRTPRISSGDESFMITDYTRPVALVERIDRRPEETAFVFPFDRPDVEARVAHSEIWSALCALEADSLLFLTNVRSVEVSNGVETLLLSRTDAPGFPRGVTVTTTTPYETWSRQWWVIDAAVTGAPAGTRCLQAALLRSEDDTAVVPVSPAPLSVVFPTAVETGLSFLVEGPFRTTPARDNITEDDWNRGLVLQAAETVVAGLHRLKGLGLLTVDVLSAMPIAASRALGRDLFDPLQTRIREALRDERLLPTESGGFAAAADLRRTTHPELRAFLPVDELTRLVGTGQEIAWLEPALTTGRTRRDFSEFLSWAGVATLTPEDFVCSLSGAQLADRDDEWLVRLYALIHETEPVSRWSRTSHWARRCPLVRLEDGSHVRAFDDAGHPLAHLPATPESSTRFPTVKDSVAADPVARTFLESLGLQRADVADELQTFVLGRYAPDAPLPEDDVVTADMDLADRAVHLKGERGRTAQSALQGVAFIRCTSATGERRLRRPSGAYHRSEHLETYFTGNADAWFVDDVYDPWNGMLRDLGVADSPRVHHFHASTSHVTLRAYHGHHERGLYGFHPDMDVDGLEHALKHPTTPRSAYLWNALLPRLASHLEGIVEKSRRQTYSDSTQVRRGSKALAHLLDASWLPDGAGEWARPLETTRGSLPEAFTSQPQLDRVLHLREDVVAAASAALDVDSSALQFLRDNPEAVKQLMLEQSRSVAEEVAPNDDFRTAQASFHSERDGLWGALARGGGPADRAAPEKVSRNLAWTAAAGESVPGPHDTSRLSERQVWSPRDATLRDELLSEYDGACQICGSGFIKADGTPYFEVQHLQERSEGGTTDLLGGVLCLCPTCRCKLLHGEVEPLGRDLLAQVSQWSLPSAGRTAPEVKLILCGEEVSVSFTDHHAEAFRRELLRPPARGGASG